MRELSKTECNKVAGGLIPVVIAVARVGYGVYQLTRATSLAGHVARGASLGYGTYSGLNKIHTELLRH